MDLRASIEKFAGKTVLIHDDMRLVALTSSSMIIRECNLWKPTGEVDFVPTEGTVLNELSALVNWAESGFISALLSHVQIVYALVEYVLDTPNSEAWLKFEEARLLAKALYRFEVWKEEFVEKEKEEKGESWGNSTLLQSTVWNRNNKNLLDLYAKKQQ